MLTLLAIFALTHVVGALSPSYDLLLATRVAGAFVYAGFWAVAAVTTVGRSPFSPSVSPASSHSRPASRSGPRPPWIAVPAIALLGAFGFAGNPAINTRVFTLAGAAPTTVAVAASRRPLHFAND